MCLRGGEKMSNRTEDLPEELYRVLADLLNRRKNIEVINSIRGEYGVLNYLCAAQEGASAGDLCKKLHVVPGRMADILKSLEQKELIERTHDSADRRVVKAHITEKGREVSLEKRQEIRDDYTGLFTLLSEEEVVELIRLLKIMLSFCPEE
jgi:DNA-binding MarR family transcriptional regulator